MKRKIFSVLFALVLACSLGLVTAVPVAAQDGVPNPTFATIDMDTITTPSDEISIGWERDPAITGEGFSGTDAIHVTTSGLTSSDFAMVIVPTDFVLEPTTTISYWGYTVSGDVKALDEIYLFLDSGDDVDEEVDTILLSHKTGPETFERYSQWDQWTLEGNYTEFQNEWHTWPDYGEVNLEGYIDHGYTVLAIALTIGPPVPGTLVNIDVYFDKLIVDGNPLLDEDTGTIDVPVSFENFPAPSIQDAIDAALLGTTITVAAGEYAGAIVNEDLNIIGAAGGASIITSGVPYKDGLGLTTAFRLDDGADGAEIRNFTMSGNYTVNFWFGVFARSADSVIVDSLILDNMVQGISNWGGSNWEITNNVITETYPTYGGGIAIYLGADPTDFPHCDNNLVQYNIITTTANQSGGFTGAAIALWFDERDGKDYVVPTTQSMTGNEIIGNSITATGLENQVGIEIGVGGLDGDENPDKVAACLGVIHDNTVTNNTIDNAEWGLYTYVTTDLIVSGNTIKNCSDCGIYMKDDHVNCLINNNNIYGNTNCGLNNTDGATYSTTVDATKNWWGDVAGPNYSTNPYAPTSGDNVSANVDYIPWLIHTELASGWNVYSTPIAPDASSSTIGDALNVWGVDSGNFSIAYYFDGSQGWGEATLLTPLTPLQAVYLKMDAAATIDVVFSTDYSEIPSKTMYAGWNLIGLAELYDMAAEDALASAYYVAGANNIGYSQVVSPGLGQTAWNATRRADIDTDIGQDMTPCEGYWLLMVNEGILGGFTSTPIAEVLP